jgi:hypothetical protein
VLQNPLIDIAIGLTLMYLVLSLVCTIVNEFIATKFKLRSKSLAAGLQELLDDPVVRNAFYDHGMISGTSKALEMCGQVSLMGAAPASPATTVTAAPNVTQAAGLAAATGAPATPTLPAASTAETQPGQHPSYLSSETFVLALVGCLTGTRVAAGGQVPTFAETQAVIQDLPPSKIKSALIASLILAEGDFEKFRKSLTTWFDDSMERLSGAYKRHLKLISILVGFGVAVALNADTFAVGYALWSNPALRSQMVSVADKTVQDGLAKASQARTSQTRSQGPNILGCGVRRDGREQGLAAHAAPGMVGRTVARTGRDRPGEASCSGVAAPDRRFRSSEGRGPLRHRSGPVPRRPVLVRRTVEGG